LLIELGVSISAALALLKPVADVDEAPLEIAVARA